MRIQPGEFQATDLRVHALLHDVPLEDVWAIRLPGGGPGRSVQEARAAFISGMAEAPAVVTGLVRLRRWIGALFGWDRPRPAWVAETFADRLSPADRARSLAQPGTPDGRLSLLYRFPNEQLSERRNGTVHAFSSFSIREVPGGYLAYLAVYVRPVHRFTRLYMALIRPFRRWIVYPAVIRKAEIAWASRFGRPLEAAGGAVPRG